MENLKWLLPLALLWPMLFVVRVLLAARLLSTLRYGPKKVEASPIESLPGHIRAGAAEVLGELRTLGYEPRQYLRYEPEWLPELVEDAIECVRPDDPIRAMVRPHYDSNQSGYVHVVFRSTFEGGMELTTTSLRRLGLIKEAPIIDCERVETLEVSALLARHRERVAARVATGDRPRQLTAGQAVDRERELLEANERRAEESRDLKPDPSGGRVFRLVPLFRNAVKIAVRAKQATKKAVKKSSILSARRSQPLDPETQLAFDRICYRRLRALRKGRLGMTVKALISVVSLAAFAAWLAWLASPAVAAALIVGLVFHEGGHLLGMKLFGYRDTQLLFIPFFGGAAVGLDEGVTLEPWKHLVILFLGPLPGLFLAAVGLAAFWDGPHWLTSSLTTVLILNLFNLIPVLPLDGGQIVDTAFTAKYPRLRTGFYLVSGLGLVCLAFISSGTWLLAVLGVFMLIRVPAESRLSKVITRVRRAQSERPGPDGALDAALLAARDPSLWKNVAAHARFQQIPAILHSALQPLPNWRTVVAALVLYTSPVWGGLSLVIWINTARGDRIVREAEARAAQAGLVLDEAPRAPEPVAAPCKAGTVVADVEAAVRAGVEGGRLGAYFSVQSGGGVTPEIRDAVARLRLIANENRFVYPIRGDAASPLKRGYLREFAFTWFAAVAREKLRDRQPEEAMDVVLDGLRLNRLFSQDRSWWGWNSYHQAQDALLNVCEEIMSSRDDTRPAVLKALYGLCDERQLMAVARATMVGGNVRMMLGYRNRHFGVPGVSDSFYFRLFFLLQRLDPSEAKRTADLIDSAVEDDGALQQAEAADWGAFRQLASQATHYQLALLGHDVARIQLARAAIACADYALRHGRSASRLEDLDGPYWQGAPVSPTTGDALTWSRLGHGDFLTFPNRRPPAGRPWMMDAPLQWRLPERI